MFNNLFQCAQKKLLISVLFKVSSIIYHNLQKKFVTDVINEVLNNIVIHKTYSASDSGMISFYKIDIFILLFFFF